MHALLVHVKLFTQKSTKCWKDFIVTAEMSKLNENKLTHSSRYQQTVYSVIAIASIHAHTIHSPHAHRFVTYKPSIRWVCVCECAPHNPSIIFPSYMSESTQSCANKNFYKTLHCKWRIKQEALRCCLH